MTLQSKIREHFLREVKIFGIQESAWIWMLRVIFVLAIVYGIYRYIRGISLIATA
ncbi:hypothetical protein AB3N59_04210 [Leptospira sp. WS92.C1]